MRLTVVVLAAALGLAGTAALAESRTARAGEAQLERLIGGRVAGEAMDCISTTNNANRFIVIDHVGLVYDARDTLYVARVEEPDRLRRSDRLEFIRASNQKLCVTDKALTVDRASDIHTGVVHLARFVPYTKRS